MTEDTTTLKSENKVLKASLDIALTALTHYRRSGAWSHIAADALEDIKRCLRGTQVSAEMPVSVSELWRELR